MCKIISGGTVITVNEKKKVYYVWSRKKKCYSKKVNQKCDICIITIFFVMTFLFRKELCSQMSTPPVVSFILWSVRTEQNTNLMPNCSYQIVCCLRKADTSGVYLRLFLVTALGLCWKQCYGVCLSGEFLTILRVKNQMREKAIVHT